MRCGSASLPEGVIVGGKVIDPAAAGQALKQLAARLEISETRALVAVSDDIATFRVLYLPHAATDKEVNAAVSRELPLDPERIAARWVEVSKAGDRRVMYAVAWDRMMLNNITDAIKLAGLDALVVELKSAAVVRNVTEASCVVLDLSSDFVEIVLVDRHVPQLWHSFELNALPTDEVAPALATPIHSMLRFYSRDRRGDLGPACPVLISGEQVLSAHALARLAELVNQPVQLLAAPKRIAPNVRHSTYLTCLGLIMRRT